jgi:hypothetical protein
VLNLEAAGRHLEVLGLRLIHRDSAHVDGRLSALDEERAGGVVTGPRLLRVLGLTGWVEWRLVRRGPHSRTYVLCFDGDLEDFDVC